MGDPLAATLEVLPLTWVITSPWSGETPSVSLPQSMYCSTSIRSWGKANRAEVHTNGCWERWLDTQSNKPPHPLLIWGDIEQARQTPWWWQMFWSEDCILQHTFLLKSLPCTSRSLTFNPVAGHIFFSHCLHGVNWINSLRAGTISITAIFYDSA